MAIFLLRDVTYWYPLGVRPALKGVNLEIQEGEFLLVLGRSGSGKSSLARVLAGLIPRFYGGRLEGRVLFKRKELSQIDQAVFARSVGIVFQDPEKQLLATSAETEIAFGLENLGLPRQEISRRIAETMEFFRLGHLDSEFTANLSGGEKQKLVLASVMAMEPEVLILDEPTSQLAPREADELLGLVERLNREIGCTVILIEQRVERCFHLAHRVALMKEGEVAIWGDPKDVASWIAKNCPEFAPPVVRLFVSLGLSSPPLTVSEGRNALAKLVGDGQLVCTKLMPAPRASQRGEGDCLASLDRIWFAYPGGKQALKGCTLEVREGDFMVITGENAAGKTTLLKNLVGRLKPTKGRALVMGKDTRSIHVANLTIGVAYLLQDPNAYLFQDTVEDELRFTLSTLGLRDDGVINEVLNRLGLDECRSANPRDLSSGERQRVALASLLVGRPRLLVLDEPTRGIDPCLKRELGRVLREITRQDGAVVVVTHDVEFAAEHANRAALMHQGRIVCEGSAREVLGRSLFYCPQVARLLGGYCSDGVLTVDEALGCLSRRCLFC